MNDFHTIRGKFLQLESLYCIIEKWQELNEKICYEWGNWDEKEAPWWYNERASLSIFAGAVWLCGGWAFEEFSAFKKAISKKGNENKRIGRCDIKFRVGKHKFVAEAKQCWPNIGSNMQEVRSKVKEDLDKACKECEQMIERNIKRDYNRLGLVFAVPRLHKSKQENIENILHQFLDELQKISNVTIAWTFPEYARSLRSPTGSDRDYIFPGIAMLARLV